MLLFCHRSDGTCGRITSVQPRRPWYRFRDKCRQKRFLLTRVFSGIGTKHEFKPTSEALVEEFFRAARVDVFASTHTCLPFAQLFGDDEKAIINNGSAGLPNFKESTFGLMTRLSSSPVVPIDSLYGAQLNGLRIDAIPVKFDSVAWKKRFLELWPEGTPAHLSYYRRISFGPNFTLEQAARRGFGARADD